VTEPIILVADDSATARATARIVLEEHAFRVLEAEDGETAVRKAAAERPDLILLDLEMPGLHGLHGHDVLDALRDDPELRDIPVVILSGRTSEDAVAEALRRGARDYVTKPFERTELLARVAVVLSAKAELDDMRRRNAELTAFAWRASHDLKSPLAAIRGMADTILAYPDRIDEPTRNNLLERISAGADQAATLVESLLALARNAELKTGAVARTADPEAVVRGVIDQARLDKAEWELEVGAWAPIAIPASEFASVVLNLVVNAGFYGRSPDGVLRLCVGGGVEDGRLVLVFTDQGGGVDPTAAARLFDPFVRGRESRTANPRSTGIGLAIVRRTVERWGGAVDLAEQDDDDNRGARFIVAVPVAPTEPVGGQEPGG
jgi:signal transduction histidine kinase